MLSIILRCMSLAQLAMVVALETSTERSGFRVLLWFGYEVTGSDGGSRFGWRLGSGSVVGSEHPNQQRIIWKATWRSKIGGSRELQSVNDSSFEEFVNELALLDSFPPRNKDDNFDPEADLREIEYLMNRDPSIDSSPKTDIYIIDPILERFSDEPALVYSFPPGDDDDDLIDFKSDNEEWKKLLYGDLFDNTRSENEKDKDLKMECLIDDMDDDFSPLLPTSDSTLPEDSSEIATLLSSPFKNEDKVFNPGILILGGTQIFHDESKDMDLKVISSTKALLILVENNFLSHSSDCFFYRELLFFLESTVIETLLSFSSKNEDKVFNPGILISNRVHSFTLGLSLQTYETFKIINVHPNILNESPMKNFPFFYFCPNDKGIRGEFPYDREDHRACFQSSNHSVSDHLHVYIQENLLS
ncbi:hypothetical protein Tco_0946644 [Tanacetum coccineum]